jgi:hypothetical protein
LIKNGMMSITITTSTFGFMIGERMKSRTSSQKLNWMSRVIQIFTMTMSSTYRQHCASQAFTDGGLPVNIRLISLQSKYQNQNSH